MAKEWWRYLRRRYRELGSWLRSERYATKPDFLFVIYLLEVHGPAGWSAGYYQLLQTKAEEHRFQSGVNNLFIGRPWNGSDGLIGTIDEVKVCNRALTDKEVIAAAEEHSLVMLFTGNGHFWH